MTTTTLATLLDHVSAYAAAVRAALRDLPPDQVDELTDGLEADLAEALEDREGPVVTGEIPLGRLAAAAGATPPTGSAALIDLTRRFGPATEYAAELRTAAGLAPASGPARAEPVVRRPGFSVRAAVERVRQTRREVVESLRASGTIGPVLGLLESFAPVWWLARAWSWWVVVMMVLNPYQYPEIFRYVPRGFWEWVGLVALVALSVADGRGWGTRRWWTAGLLGVAGLVAGGYLLVIVPAAYSLLQAVRWDGGSSVEYVEVPVEVPQAQPQEGVFVDGMQVSNLYVYDADGDPLQGVQIFDDRGRPVRTTFDGGWLPWELPGVSEPWFLAAAMDGDGRARWNVYPLLGAPASAWDVENPDGPPVLLEGEALRSPPPPFAKAPVVVVGAGAAGAQD